MTSELAQMSADKDAGWGHAAASIKNAVYEPDYSIVGTGECYENMTPEEEAAMDAEDYRRAMEVLAEIEAGARTYTLAEIKAKHAHLEH